MFCISCMPGVPTAILIFDLARCSIPQLRVFQLVPTRVGTSGGPNGAVIVRNAQGIVGRWVVAQHAPHDVTGNPGNHGHKPRVTRSPDGGAAWSNSVDLTRAWHPAQSTSEEIKWSYPVPAAGDPYPQVLPEFGPYVLNTPSLAVDPKVETKMYLAFLGRTSSESGLNTYDNIDLMIAQSTDGGVDFSGDPVGSNVLHLTDSDLGDPAGAIQFLPAITVVNSGAVHILYYAAWLEQGIWTYRVKLATIDAFSVTSHPSVSHLNLTDVFDMEDGLQGSLSFNRRFFGDYIQVDSMDCEVWGMYVAKLSGEATFGTYVAQVNWCMDSDSNRDGLVTTMDPSVFANYFILNDPRADLNHNSTIEASDVTRFLESYSCACNP